MSRKLLSDMGPGERGTVYEINSTGTLRRRMMDMGIVRGVEVIVVRRAPLGDPVEFLLRGYNLTLRKHEASAIALELGDHDE